MGAAEAVSAVVKNCGLSREEATIVVGEIVAEANYGETPEATSEAVAFPLETFGCGAECCGSWTGLRIEGPSGVLEYENVMTFAAEFGLISE